MKKAHLFLAQYSRGLHQEIPILLEIFLLTFILVCSVSPFMNTLSLNKLTSECVPAGYYKLDTTSTAPISREALQRLLPDARAGRVLLSGTSLNIAGREFRIETFLYDSFLLEDIPMPVEAGQWFVKNEHEPLIPIAIGGALREALAVGASVDISCFYCDEETRDYPQYLLSCVVIAHLPGNAVHLGGTAYGTTDMTNGVLSYAAPDENTVLIPLPNNALPDANYTYHMLSDTPLTGEASAYARAIAGSGRNIRVFSRDTLCQQAFEQMLTQYSLWYLLGVIAACFLLLNVFIYLLLQIHEKAPVYLIYYRCGMKPAASVYLAVCPISILVMFMYGIGLVVGLAVRSSMFYVISSAAPVEAFIPLVPILLAVIPGLIYAKHFMKTRFFNR